MIKKHANFLFENKLWKKNIRVVAGADEVGRGCFAGPVVAGCVVFDKSITRSQGIKGTTGIKARDTRGTPNAHDTLTIIDDSKKLTAKQREKAAVWIKKNSLTWGIGEISATLINRIGMAKATKMAFRRAIAQASQRLSSKSKIEFLLIDAFFIPYARGLRRKNQLAIVHGDEKSKSIGAASIIAKVYRDKLMRRLSKKYKYKKYGWGRNKGYGTAEHRLAIKKYGITRYHRKQFIQTFLKGKRT